MASICRLDGIVIRILMTRDLGVRLHALWGETEMVLSVNPLRVIQGEAPASVREKVLRWAEAHRPELLGLWHRYTLGRPAFMLAEA